MKQVKKVFFLLIVSIIIFIIKVWLLFRTICSFSQILKYEEALLLDNKVFTLDSLGK